MGLENILRKARKSAVLLGRPSNRAALLRHGVAGSIEHDAVLKAEAVDVIVDVGANRGQFSLAGRHFHPQARIVAFEPLADAAAAYRKVFAGDDRVQLHQSAVGPMRGDAVMYRSASEDSSSLLPIGALMPELYPGTEAAGTETVKLAPLTEFLTPTDLSGHALLKIDVQGYELEVLKSAGPLLPLFSRLYVEASFVPFYDGQPLTDEVIAYLREQDFQLVGFMNPSFHPVTGAAVQSDLLFTASRL